VSTHAISVVLALVALANSVNVQTVPMLRFHCVTGVSILEPENNFKLSWLSYSIKLVKILSVCRLCVCLDVNHGGTNHNRCTQRLVILYQ